MTWHIHRWKLAEGKVYYILRCERCGKTKPYYVE